MAVIIDYDAGNLRSVQRACREVGLAAAITADPGALLHADRIIFPGVGAAGSAMRSITGRAIGQALGRNPVPLAIPCHRILRSDGALGGFSGGLHWKELLLKMESGA